MASVKDKLSQLGRQVKPIKLLSLDETQEVDVYYQCLTTLKERILREAMREQYDEAIRVFRAKKHEDEPSMFERWTKEFVNIGAHKCAEFIVANDRMSIRTEAIKEMSREPLAPGATPEEEKVWLEEFTPIFERIYKENVAAIEESPIEELAEKAVEIQVDLQANAQAYATYRLRLIQESILEPEVDVLGEPLTPPKYKLVFDSTDEIEELLAASTIDSLSTKIADEVREAKTVPLKSA